MSGSKPDIPLSSPENSSVIESEEVKQELTISVNESNSPENVKVPTSKIAKPTGLKLQTPTNSTRIGRLCNNIPKPAIPPNPGANHFVCRTIGWSFRETVADRVSLRDIGIRQPVVQFHLDYLPRKNWTGAGGGEDMSASVRRVSDALARKKLTDVEESDENTVPYGNGKWAFDRKMSSGSVLSDSSRKSDELRKKRSSDASMSVDSFSDYWRSEFEPRRASDASVVLTEDTDQFIIGDRVWVGGVKPGQIAYIGETQFAPGEWAGVVLDEPIGKNDGTVANIRYFQCEPKKGIFSRLTRLTRYPLADEGAGEPSVPRPASAEARRSNGNLLASVPKKSSLVLTPSTASKALSKPPSPDSSLQPSVQVGDRVIVKSSQGSKAGVLRYLGTTDFAAGEWCGVELDDPLGKNDGSVGGTRYFDCRPKFGLFAPLHKVSKSPAGKRPSQGNCVIHNRSGAATPGVRRQGSKESLVSLSSTASTAASVRSTNRKIGVRTPTTPTSAKNALQETLKEKELHIEQLLKERDLERAEVTRAASQADEAERRLAAFRQEFEQQKEEAEARTADLEALACLLRSENEELKNLLEDERKKYEDLQFRFEEETIDKADLKSVSMKYEEKLQMLEKTLFEERKRTEALEQDSNKLFEAEEQLVILKDELDSAKEETTELKKMRGALEQKHISLEAHLTSARAEIESLKIENETLKSSATQDQNKLQENVLRAVEAFEDCKKELKKKESEIEHLLEQLKAKDESGTEKEKELHAKYLKIMNELTEKQKAETGSLSKELEDLKTGSEAKIKVLEKQLEEKMKLCTNLETEVNQVNIALSKTSAEKSVEQTKRKETEEKLERKLKETLETLSEKNDLLATETEKCKKLLEERQRMEEEMSEFRKSSSVAWESTEKQQLELKKKVEEQKKEMNELKEKHELKSKECDSLKDILQANKKEAEDRFGELEKLISGKNYEMEKLKEEVAKTSEEFNIKAREIKDVYVSNEKSLKSEIKALEEAESKRKKDEEGLIRDLESAKTAVTVKENELKMEQNNNKSLADKLAALDLEYKKVSKERDQLELEAGDTLRKVESLQEKLSLVTSQKSKLESDISNFINTSNDSSLQLTKLNEDLRSKEKELDALREALSQKSLAAERREQEVKQRLEKQEAELRASQQEIERLKRDREKEIEILEKKLEVETNSLKNSEDSLKKEIESLTNHSNTRAKELEEYLVSMKKKEEESKSKHEEEVKKMLNLQEELKKKLAEIEAAAEESKNSLERKIEELNSERNNLVEAVEKAKSECLNSEKISAEKLKKEAEAHGNEIEKLRTELKESTDKLRATLEELSRAKDEKLKSEEERSREEKARTAMEELVRELEMKNTELEVRTSSVDSENKLLQDTVSQLREEKCLLDKESTEKMILVTELRSQIEALEYSRKTGDAEKEIRMRNLEEETSELCSKLQKREAAHSSELLEKDKMLEELRAEAKRLKEECGRLTLGKEEELEKANVHLDQMRKEMEEMKLESKRRNEESSKMEKQLRQVREELEAEKVKSEEYGKRLNVSETERVDLKERFEEQSKLLADEVESGTKLAEVRQKLMEAEKREAETASNAKLERETLEKMLETTNGLLNQKENEAMALTKEVEALKQEKALLASSSNSRVEVLEKETAELQKKLTELKGVSENGKAEDLEEEREFQKGQVDFLNSVIVDMQKKNDALKARIEILEMGFSPEDVDEFNLHNITMRSVAPRLFCDICDRFDVHDTEDCPTQANEDVPPPKSSRTKAPPPERPYCETCEVFGHNTEDCDDAETF